MSNIKIFTKNIEQEAIDQLDELLGLDVFKECKIRIMPDVHTGNGCVIGFTADLGDKVIPNIVGVDIGCGMLTLNMGKVSVDPSELDKVIRKVVPSGHNIQPSVKYNFPELEKILCLREIKDHKRILRSLGTLGGGNHFIELDVDEEGNKYLIVHTGSRNLGKQVADHYQDLAVKLCSGMKEYYDEKDEIIKTYKEAGRRKEIEKVLKSMLKKYRGAAPELPKDLCYLDGKYRDMYIHDMQICQRYASLNREYIVKSIVEELFEKEFVIDSNQYVSKSNSFSYFHTIHNYIDLETNYVRKGAISAKKDEMLLIPINMRDGCILGRGKGNEDWNFSAPHGAGRIMSRTKAKETLCLADFKESMKNVYSTSVNEKTLDEAPFVYKTLNEIVDNIGDSVDVIKIIKPIYNYKDS